MVRLSEELEKEKQKFAQLECQLQNIERSRDDVEMKNKLLEQKISDSIKSMSQSELKTK